MKTLKQVGALCVCQADDGDELLVLLVTSRDTRRWVIPKGWPAKSLKAHQAAAREAKEEAGVQGRVSSTIFGKYRYTRPDKAGDQTHIVSGTEACLVFLIFGSPARCRAGVANSHQETSADDGSS